MSRTQKGAASEPRGSFVPPQRAAAQGTDPLPPSGSRLAPRNWRVRTRLNAILLIPVVIALVFGGLRVSSAVDTWRQAQDAERTAELVQVASTYAYAVMNERDVSAEPLLAGRSGDTQVRKARALTDQAAEAFEERLKDIPHSAALDRRIDNIHEAQKALPKIRAAAYTPKLKGVDTEEGYALVYRGLLSLSNELGLGTSNITSFGRSLYAIGLTASAASLDRSIGMRLLFDTRGSGRSHKAALPTDREAFSSYARLEVIAAEEFETGGRPQDSTHLKSALDTARAKGKQQAAKAAAAAKAKGQRFVPPPQITTMTKLMISPASTASALTAKGITPQTWWASSTGKFEAYKKVQEDLADEAVSEAHQIASDARRDAVVNAAVALASLIIALGLAALMARQMGRGMRRLRNAAFGIAEQRLPMLVDQLSRAEPERVDTRVQPIPITSRDEIGEVARAFDQVHREAVRLAAEQALLRGNINAIFTNLSRRNQGLVERQLELVSGLEESEADPDQLEHLFQMDHLATRMRRNGENLLVLAGEDTGRHWDQPVPLLDVLRAATSEVESYERIEVTGVPESDIHGTAVTDLVHLLAELLENATTFSSPHTKVRVTATRLPDRRLMIEIHDKGIGLTAEDFADINHRLANPPTVDAAISQRMGLFVVGRLADRHGIRVQLRPSGEQSGTTSLVMLPEAITHGGGGDPLAHQEEEFTVSRIVGTAPERGGFPPDIGPQRTAADFGFDDGAYGDPAYDDPAAFPREPGPAAAPAMDPGLLDPVGRSLLREERRAALEARANANAEADNDRPLFRDQVNGAGRDGAGRDDAWQGTLHDGAQEGAHGPESGSGGPLHPADHGEAVERQHAAYGAYEPPVPNGAGPATPGQPVRFDPSGASHPEVPAVDENGWRTDNDERWERAAKLRAPEAGGVTAAGLPRRVPRANLVDGTASQAPQGGPQVSRAPEDVRGRLSNLRRGVEQGRGRHTGRGPDQNDQPGPHGTSGSTYDQER